VKRLLLLRHAKAVPASPGIEDHERELMARGREDAPAIGRYMTSNAFVPDLIVCSTARRTVETADLLTAQLPATRQIEYAEELYLAEPGTIFAVIRGAPERAKTLMVIGHNPGIEHLATMLAREPVKRKERNRFDLIEEKYPTAALAVLDFDAARWRDVVPGTGALTDFIRPRDL
jgi:phosphohistidine phosphatase